MITPKYNIHVVPRGLNWAIIEDITDKQLGFCNTPEVAITRGRDIAKNKGVKVIIHDNNGQVFRIESFENR